MADQLNLSPSEITRQLTSIETELYALLILEAQYNRTAAAVSQAISSLQIEKIRLNKIKEGR